MLVNPKIIIGRNRRTKTYIAVITVAGKAIYIAFTGKRSKSCVIDLVNRGISTARRAHASLYNWIVYKRGSKAREREGEEEQRRSK